LAAQLPTQQGLLDSLQEDHACFQQLINRLNEEEQQTAITPEGWSFKDFLSHMSHWKAATQKLIVAYTHDQPLPPVTPSGDKANAVAREMDKDLSLPQVTRCVRPGTKTPLNLSVPWLLPSASMTRNILS
jgi:hypothetical protein